jgi:hypothetical protein
VGLFWLSAGGLEFFCCLWNVVWKGWRIFSFVKNGKNFFKVRVYGITGSELELVCFIMIAARVILVLRLN